MSKRALVFQHMEDEPPGLFGEALRARGFAIDTVHLYRGGTIPSLASYEFLLVMGGSMDVWEEEQHPWLVAEKQAIREWATCHQRPYFGVCLGMQLLAEALGGKVGLARSAEVGVGRINLVGQHALVAGLPRSFRMMQWHHAEVTEMPAGAVNLASSDITAVQIMAVGENLLGTQFHGELTPELIEQWARIPEYIQWLEDALGNNAYEIVKADALPLMPRMRKISERMLCNLLDQKAVALAA